MTTTVDTKIDQQIANMDNAIALPRKNGELVFDGKTLDRSDERLAQLKFVDLQRSKQHHLQYMYNHVH